MRISYDSAKRDKTFADRGLDFEDAVEVFHGLIVEVEDARLHPAWLGTPHLQHAKGQ